MDRGSPPRVRGKGAGRRSPSSQSGITPACAGKRTRPRRWVRPPRDHPRVCGEKLRCTGGNETGVGSPPRVRGKGCPMKKRNGLTRITPACAGKRTIYVKPLQFSRDHPRVCGEKLVYECLYSPAEGSPPRMRGKDVGIHDDTGLTGITPACAGKSSSVPAGVLARWDHPRVCGEKRNERPVGAVP